jgi:hypothetical protein
MTVITLEIPDELADRLRLVGEQVARLHGLSPRVPALNHPSAYSNIHGVLEFLAALPSPEEVLALRADESLQTRISALLEKNRTTGLTPEEAQEFDQYEYLDHLVRIAKAKAYLKLHGG